jgi:8-oxo-dGTP pyrophosphatase MutT (NUDIX family)
VVNIVFKNFKGNNKVMNDIIKKQIEKYTPYNVQEENDKEMMLKYIDTFEDVVTRENKMCHFTASNWIVNKERTKVLMIYHNIYKSWDWTGGHADGDSNLLHVALKEAEEETGIKNFKVLSNGIYGLQIITVDSHIKRGKFVPSHLHLDCCFLLEADESETLKIKLDENSGVKWIDIDKAVEITSEEKMKPIYRKLIEKYDGLEIV